MVFGVDDVLMAAMIASATSTAVSAYSTVQANKQQQKATAIERRRRLAEDQMNRRSMVRERMIATSDLLAGATATGTMGSSGFYGAGSSIASQWGAKNGFISGQQTLLGQESTAQTKAANWMYTGQLSQDIGSAITSGVQMYGTMRTMTPGGGRIVQQPQPAQSPNNPAQPTFIYPR